MTTAPDRRPRPIRNAANRASVKISAAARRENSPDAAGGPTGALLDEALIPTQDQNGDQTHWKAWVEIESEPAFFNGLIRDLGVDDVKVVEVVSLDPDVITQVLPQPVFGFIFLCKYAGEAKDETIEETAEPPTELWFANQTMANGCATVTLLNIVMNQPSITLGPDLTAFRSSTAHLGPTMRGWVLETNPSLRQVHNSYARCLEHLNADLLVSNEYEDCGGWPADEDTNNSNGNININNNNNNNKQKPTATKRARKTISAATSRKRRRADEDANHYKAFVHVGGQVWVLDGLEENPISLGPATADSWIETALTGIQTRLAAADDMMVNVLAVCQSPTVKLREELLANIRTLSALRAALPACARPDKIDGRLYLDDNGGGLDEAVLASYGVTRAQLDAAAPDASVLDHALIDKDKVVAIRQLQTEQARIQSEFMQEMGDVQRDEEQCSGRKKDFSNAIHRWVKKIAERGALQSLVG